MWCFSPICFGTLTFLWWRVFGGSQGFAPQLLGSSSSAECLKETLNLGAEVERTEALFKNITFLPVNELKRYGNPWNSKNMIYPDAFLGWFSNIFHTAGLPQNPGLCLDPLVFLDTVDISSGNQTWLKNPRCTLFNILVAMENHHF